MQRMLLRNVLTNSTYILISLTLVFGMILFLEHFILGSGESIWESMDGMFTGWVAPALIILSNAIDMKRLPDSVFLLPFSRKDREKMVTVHAVIWVLLATFYISALICTPMLLRKIQTDVPDDVLGWNCILWILFAGNAVYLFGYFSYFEKVHKRILYMNNISVFTITLVEYFVIVIISGITEQFATEGVVLVMMVIITCSIFFAISYHFHKKYFRKMIEFYADYEKSRWLESGKVRA